MSEAKPSFLPFPAPWYILEPHSCGSLLTCGNQALTSVICLLLCNSNPLPSTPPSLHPSFFTGLFTYRRFTPHKTHTKTKQMQNKDFLLNALDRLLTLFCSNGKNYKKILQKFKTSSILRRIKIKQSRSQKNTVSKKIQ